MAGGLLFADSFGHYSTLATMATKWTSAPSGGFVTGVDTGSTRAFRGSAYKTLGANRTLNLGARHYMGGSKILCEFQDGQTGVLIRFSILGDGRITVYCQQNNDGPYSSTSTYDLSFGAEYFIQIYCTMNPYITTGTSFKTDYTFAVKINDIVRHSGTLTSGPSGLPGGFTINDISFAETRVYSDDGLGGWLGDLWVTTGEYLGDLKIVPLFPRANGSTVQWTPAAGTNWENVEEHFPPDENTSYNSALTVGLTDLYYMDLIGAFSGVIKGAQGVWRVENEVPGGTQFVGVYRNGAGTVVDTPDSYSPSSGTYQYFLDQNRKSPFTGLDYTSAEIDASQTGLKKTV